MEFFRSLLIPSEGTFSTRSTKSPNKSIQAARKDRYSSLPAGSGSGPSGLASQRSSTGTDTPTPHRRRTVRCRASRVSTTQYVAHTQFQPAAVSVRRRQRPRLAGYRMSIRDHYKSTLDAIAGKYGETISDAQIGPSDSLQTAIGYTRQYVVDHTTPHFRYDYYRDALSRALNRLRFDPADRHVVHLDIGCGPGVFSWVMHDRMESRKAHRPDSVVYYGYDHCANMIGLASLFLDGLPDQYDFHGYCDLAHIRTVLMDEDLSNCDVVVTFGYALVQVRNDPAALEVFADTIRRLFPSRSCIVVAADAHHNREMRNAFDSQCNALEAALNKFGVRLEDRESPVQGSIMFARLDME